MSWSLLSNWDDFSKSAFQGYESLHAPVSTPPPTANLRRCVSGAHSAFPGDGREYSLEEEFARGRGSAASQGLMREPAVRTHCLPIMDSSYADHQSQASFCGARPRLTVGEMKTDCRR